MEKAHMLALVIGPFYLIMGLSLLLYADQWKRVISEFAKNHFIMLVGAFMSLILGLIIINMYSVWDWSLNVVITISGWGAFVKGAFYFLAPEEWIKSTLKSSLYKEENTLYISGSIMTVFGILLSYNAYFVG